MKFIIPFLGKTREAYIEEGIQDYSKRLSRFVEVEIPVLKNKVSSSIPDEKLKLCEAKLLADKIKTPSFVVAREATGKTKNSPQMAELIEDWENQGVQLVYFLIGGHLGLHVDVLKQADLTLSLSKLTFTHEMSRLFLLEQLYRAWMIKSGQKYHN